MRLQEKSRTELEAFQAECQQAYKQFQAENLKLDMSEEASTSTVGTEHGYDGLPEEGRLSG